MSHRHRRPRGQAGPISASSRPRPTLSIPQSLPPSDWRTHHRGEQGRPPWVPNGGSRAVPKEEGRTGEDSLSTGYWSITVSPAPQVRCPTLLTHSEASTS